MLYYMSASVLHPSNTEIPEIWKIYNKWLKISSKLKDSKCKEVKKPHVLVLQDLVVVI